MARAVASALTEEREAAAAAHEAALAEAVGIARSAALAEAAAAAASEQQALTQAARESAREEASRGRAAAVEAARAAGRAEGAAALEATRIQLTQRDEQLSAAVASAAWERQVRPASAITLLSTFASSPPPLSLRAPFLFSTPYRLSPALRSLPLTTWAQLPYPLRQLAAASAEAQSDEAVTAAERLESARAWHAATAAASADLEAAVEAAREAAGGWRERRLAAASAAIDAANNEALAAAVAARDEAVAARAAASLFGSAFGEKKAPRPEAATAAEMAEAVQRAVEEANQLALRRQLTAVEAAKAEAEAEAKAEAAKAVEALAEARAAQTHAEDALATLRKNVEQQQVAAAAVVAAAAEQPSVLVPAADAFAGAFGSAFPAATLPPAPLAIELSSQSLPVASPLASESPLAPTAGAEPSLLDAFLAATASVAEGSPVKQLFLKLARHDAAFKALDLAHDAELSRWPVDRQAATLALLAGNPYVHKANFVGLNLSDAVAPSLARTLRSPDGRLEVLNLEQNDLREPGLLQIVER